MVVPVPAGLRRPGAAALATLALACGGSPAPPGGSPAFKVSGIGDSIMQGYDAGGCGLLFCGEQPDYSFAQGTQLATNSVYSRYRALGLLPQGEQFVSVSGAEMVNDAKRQAEAVCALAQRPDRIVLLLGGNDVCNRTSLATMYPVARISAGFSATSSRPCWAWKCPLTTRLGSGPSCPRSSSRIRSCD